MRIVGGRHRGKRLSAPAGEALRPTSERAREALFDILAGGRHGAGDRTRDARVLDAFAGTGALGLEALSRGAECAVFMERSSEALVALRTNLRALHEEERARVLRCDVLVPPAAERPSDLVFLDPPYGEDLGGAAIIALDAAGWIDADALIVLELSARESFSPPAGFCLVDERRYGAARLCFLTR